MRLQRRLCHMKTCRCSCLQYPLFWACGLALLLAASTTAWANSLTFKVSGTFGNGQQLTGQVTWDSTLSTVTSSVLQLSGSTFNSVCSSSNGTCGGVWASFLGTGLFSGSEMLQGGLRPNNSQFVLTLLNGSHAQKLHTKVSWSAVRVPEEPLGADLLVELAVLALGLRFLPKRRLRTSAAT
jgi:hypothetical protein